MNTSARKGPRGFAAAPPPLPPLPERAAFYGLLALLAWLPLPWGSHRPWAEHLFVLWAGVLLVLACVGRAASGGPLPARYRWGALLWLPWLAWVLLQTLSLPEGRLTAWSPAAALAHAAAAPMNGAPLDTLSIMPGATLAAWQLSLGYLALYLSVALTCRDRSRRRLVAVVLVLAGLFQAVYGSLMTLSGAELGFFARKQFYLGYATGTFVNRNHLAAYLELTSAVGLGLVLADLKEAGAGSWRLRLSNWIELAFSTKLRVRIALGVMVIALVLTRSRMGNTAFFVALSLTGLAWVLLRERRLFLRALLLFASLLAVDTLIVSHWFGLDQVVSRIQTTRLEQEERPLVYQELPRLLAQYRVTGSGLGSFAQAFMPYRPAEMKGYYDHAHNDYIEFLVETGVPGLGLLLLLAGVHVLYALRVAWKREERLPQGICVGFVMATLALAMHAAVEFNFQIPAIAASYVALMGLVLSCSQRRGRRARLAVAAEGAAGSEITPMADASHQG
jgi:O-antigen ligase